MLNQSEFIVLIITRNHLLQVSIGNLATIVLMGIAQVVTAAVPFYLIFSIEAEGIDFKTDIIDSIMDIGDSIEEATLVSVEDFDAFD